MCDSRDMETESVARHDQAEGRWGLNRLAVTATNHCLTGCVIGEVAGMAIATALGWGNGAQIALAVALAYLFGFSLTSIPLFRAGLTFGVVVSTALAVDTLSITIMEAIDNLTVIVWPGAMDAGLGTCSSTAASQLASRSPTRSPSWRIAI